MLRLNFSNLETEIEDVKLYYEIRKLTGHKCGFFGNSETSYTENKISDLTDDLSEISKILYEELNSNTFRVSCKSIDFSIDFRDAVDINEKINDMLIEAASNGKREIFIYEKELWNDEILSELSQNGFTITEEKEGFIEDPSLHISW